MNTQWPFRNVSSLRAQPVLPGLDREQRRLTWALVRRPRKKVLSAREAFSRPRPQRPVRGLPMRHDPVMVQEILADFALQPGDVVVDGTLGLGGHSREFSRAVAPGGTVVGFDWDAAMLGEAKVRLGSPSGVRLELVNEDFRQIRAVLERLGLNANAILLDLGLNSAQIEDPSRGFSFLAEGPLDMRMDRSRGEPAAALLNRLAPGLIEEMLLDYGDERWARAIAREIVNRRREDPLRTTHDLVECVLAAIPPKARDKRIHPATRTFQAVRIAVNRELHALDQALRNAAEVLAPGGVLAVLSYHSGEDRIVKNVFRDLTAEVPTFVDLHKKPLTAADDEVRRNPRARSAKLRSLRRIA